MLFFPCNLLLLSFPLYIYIYESINQQIYYYAFYQLFFKIINIPTDFFFLIFVYTYILFWIFKIDSTLQ